MTKKTTIIIAVLALLALGAVLFFGKKDTEPQNTVSNEADMAIRAQIADFGVQLQKVSLLAPSADLSAALDENYGPYLTPELLAAWKADPSQALGRSVSSPWPDRIEVHAVTPRGDNSYTVTGDIIEITSSDTEPAATYPVELTVEQRDGTWRIADVEKGPYAEPESVTVEGKWECLPHRDTSGPQTMECAFGIAQDGSAAHYALNLQSLGSGPIDHPTGTHVRVEGTLVPKNESNSSAWEKYAIEGVIAVTSIQEL